MRYQEIIREAIHAPFGEEILAIFQREIKTATTSDDLRTALEAHLTTFLQGKLDTMNVRRSMVLQVHFRDATDDYPNGGYFRAEDNTTPGMPPLPDNTMEIVAVLPEGRIESLLNPSSSYQNESNISQLAQIIHHEFIHAIQFAKGNKYGPLALYTHGRTRPKVDGKRVGKRGGYVGREDGRVAHRYYGQNIEISAHAAQAAAEIIFQARKEAPDQQGAFISKVLRTMRGPSKTMSEYRELFKDVNLLAAMFGTKANPQSTKQKAQVWAMFKRELAHHLMDYVTPLAKD